MSGYEIEPIEGLPEPLPPGERILWQGRPAWRGLAVRALHVRKAAIYAGLILLWQGASAIADGQALGGVAIGLAIAAGIALTGIGLLLAIAWLLAWATVYTITDRRVVMRFGVAFPMTVNLPFRMIGQAHLRLDRDGSGDLPLELIGDDRIAWLALWPHVRPWRVRRPEPMLRAVPDAAAAARILGDALNQAIGARHQQPASVTTVDGSLASAA